MYKGFGSVIARSGPFRRMAGYLLAVSLVIYRIAKGLPNIVHLAFRAAFFMFHITACRAPFRFLNSLCSTFGINLTQSGVRGSNPD